MILFIEIRIMHQKNKMFVQKQIHNLIELEILQVTIILLNNKLSEIYQLLWDKIKNKWEIKNKEQMFREVGYHLKIQDLRIL